MVIQIRDVGYCSESCNNIEDAVNTAMGENPTWVFKTLVEINDRIMAIFDVNLPPMEAVAVKFEKPRVEAIKEGGWYNIFLIIANGKRLLVQRASPSKVISAGKHIAKYYCVPFKEPEHDGN